MSYVIAAYKDGPYPVAFVLWNGDFCHSKRHALRLECEEEALAIRSDMQERFQSLNWTIVPMPGGVQ